MAKKQVAAEELVIEFKRRAENAYSIDLDCMGEMLFSPRCLTSEGGTVWLHVDALYSVGGRKVDKQHQVCQLCFAFPKDFHVTIRRLQRHADATNRWLDRAERLRDRKTKVEAKAAERLRREQGKRERLVD